MPEVRLASERRTLHCDAGRNLYDLLSAEGLIDAPCGGAGTCGKCGVDVDGETVLSCLCTVNHDLKVRTGPAAAMDEIVASGRAVDIPIDNAPASALGVCVDVGTTTVVATLVSLHTGAELASLGKLNSQKAHGQDVITRIHFTIDDPQGLSLLNGLIVADIDGLVEGLCRAAHTTCDRVESIVVCGNTTMVHLLVGADPKGIAHAPFTPSLTGPVQVHGSDLGLTHAPTATVFCLPPVAAFVGGDITSGMLACDLLHAEERVLFMDIGTNGEIVLADGDRTACCSCAAGPALEGMNVSCGMRATAGAIEDVRIKRGEVVCDMIGHGQPRGVCGSGIVSAMATFVSHGIVGRTGRLQRTNPFVDEVDGKLAVRLCRDPDICLTQGDVRQIQLAKGAILSGVTALLRHCEVAPEEVGRVIVAGQFGAHIRPDDLVDAGFVPRCWSGRIEYAGNTSLAGGRLCLLSTSARSQSLHLAQGADYVELSTLPGYENLFMSCLSFS